MPDAFCGFISHLIGRETINIPEIFSGVHGFTGKTVIVSITNSFVVALQKHFGYDQSLKVMILAKK